MTDADIIDNLLYGTHRMDADQSHVIIAWEQWLRIKGAVGRLEATVKEYERPGAYALLNNRGKMPMRPYHDDTPPADDPASSVPWRAAH